MTMPVTLTLCNVNIHLFRLYIMLTLYLGGRYYDHARNAHIELSSVEVVGPGNSGTCQVSRVITLTLC